MCSGNRCCSGKAIIITYAECVSMTFSIQNVMCLRHIFLACPTLQYFSTLSHKLHDFRKKEDTRHVQCTLFLSGFNENWFFSRYFRKILKCKILLLYLYRTRCKITQLSIPTHAQLQRHRLKFIKKTSKNSYVFRSTTIFR